MPVIVGIHDQCMGIGIDLISMCDIRYCEEDSSFAVSEINLKTDLGTLQALHNITGNSSAWRELAYTGRKFTA